MRNTRNIDDYRVIFSFRLARYLENKGFVILMTRPDLKDTGRNVFLFENTPQLKQAIDTYMD